MQSVAATLPVAEVLWGRGGRRNRWCTGGSLQQRITIVISKTKGSGLCHAASSIISIVFRQRRDFPYGSSSPVFWGANGIIRHHPSTLAGFPLASHFWGSCPNFNQTFHLKNIAFYVRVNIIGRLPHIFVIVVGKNILNKPLLLMEGWLSPICL